MSVDLYNQHCLVLCEVISLHGQLFIMVKTDPARFPPHAQLFPVFNHSSPLCSPSSALNAQQRALCPLV